ncbi:unnamed protein product, partial [Rotaria sordida]|jgi:hypothetical protein
LSNS